jgi:hypothetical protein
MTQQLNDDQNVDDVDTTMIINTIPILWLPDTDFVAGTQEQKFLRQIISFIIVIHMKPPEAVLNIDFLVAIHYVCR